MRVTNWVTARVNNIAKNVNYEEPHKLIEKWNKAELKNWCKWHGVTAGARNKKQLFIYVNELRSNKDSHLEVITNPGGEVRNVTNCLRTMSRMISILMQTEINEVSDILITEWHDDFEPNTQSKQNRGSVWILSVTILSTRDTVSYTHLTLPTMRTV